MEGMEGSVSRTGIISMATLNTTLSISRHIPSPTCSPSPGQASPVLPTFLFQSYPHSGVQQPGPAADTQRTTFSTEGKQSVPLGPGQDGIQAWSDW